MKQATLSYYGQTWKMWNPGSGRIGLHYNKREVYERQLLVDVKQRSLTGSAFDVGAHIGNHAIWFAKVCGLTVHAFEPHRGSLDQLYANLALNDMEMAVYEWAAGDRHTTGRFTPGMWVAFDPDRDGAEMDLDRGDIDVHPIDDMVDVPDLAVVKVDIEGTEADALRGMTRHLKRSHPVVYTEAHTQEDWDAQAEVLEPLGYRMEKVIQMGSRSLRWRA